MSETITDRPGRRLELLEATPERTVTWTRHAPGQEGTQPHVHHEHADAFYVLEGELTLPVGSAGERVTIGPGGFVSVPPGVVHCFRNASGADALWLNVHAPDAGFAGYLRSARDGTPTPDWDDHEPPADGGRPASDVTVVHDHGATELAALGVRVTGVVDGVPQVQLAR